MVFGYEAYAGISAPGLDMDQGKSGRKQAAKKAARCTMPALVGQRRSQHDPKQSFLRQEAVVPPARKKLSILFQACSLLPVAVLHRGDAA